MSKIIPDKPPAPRAAAVTEHLQASKRILAALEREIPGLLLAVIEGRPGAKEDLAVLREKITAAKFEIEHHAAARMLAERQDEEALIQWKAAVQTLPPEEAIAGIGKEVCCRRCIPGTNCAITGSDPLAGSCQHPLIGGALDQLRYRDSPKILALYDSACRKLGLMRKLHA